MACGGDTFDDYSNHLIERFQRECRPERVQLAHIAPTLHHRIDGENVRHVECLANVVGSLPPIVVHRSTMRVIDGMHRLRAAILTNQTWVDVHFFDGTEYESFVLWVKLNSAHGLPLSREDRLAAAKRILRECPAWSDRAIAVLAGVSPKTVGAARRRASEEIPQSDGRRGRDGRIRPVSTARGRRLAGRLLADFPHASLREIASASGVSVGTVRDVRQRLAVGNDVVPPGRATAPNGRAVGRPSDQRTLPVEPDSSFRLLQDLKRDPSLRFSERGRVLLRSLEANISPTTTWFRFAEIVPVHCRSSVARAARQCAASWLHFAQQLESCEAQLAAPIPRTNTSSR